MRLLASLERWERQYEPRRRASAPQCTCIGRSVPDSSSRSTRSLTYLRLANHRVGLLLNFGAALMKDGVTGLVNALP